MSSEGNSIESRKLLSELLESQLKSIPLERKLRYKDLCRITKYIDMSPFDEDECCLWTGYVTNLKNISKGTYINFYFRKRKVAFHRLFYENFVEQLEDDEYIKFSCENRGKCCNVNHMIKYKYNNAHEESKKEKKVVKKDVKPKEIDPSMFVITFD
jgi:hypothetical protein